MTLSRRRFLTISASFAVVPHIATAHSWQGHAFGAEVSVTIHGPKDPAQTALIDAHQMIRRVEALFSLYDPASALSQLNATGVLLRPDPLFYALMQAAQTAYDLTDGLFDPTVQPLWSALAQNQIPDHGPAASTNAIGWHRVQTTPQAIRLAKGQALTFNGIAQGFATDLVSDVLQNHGLTNTLVNIGEYRGQGGPWRLGLYDPDHGDLGMRTVTTGAIATSSPRATPLGQHGHIVHPTAHPQWSTVSVEAPSATLADSLSTAMVLAPLDQIKAIKARAAVSRITLVDPFGDLITV